MSGQETFTAAEIEEIRKGLREANDAARKVLLARGHTVNPRILDWQRKKANEVASREPVDDGYDWVRREWSRQ